MTRDIRTTDAFTACDVCGRTLLRGEKPEVYLNGGARRSVCELCKERAIHEGWIREGTVPAYDDNGSSSERRRGIFSRFRARRDPGPPPQASPTLADDLDGYSWSESRPRYETEREQRGVGRADPDDGRDRDGRDRDGRDRDGRDRDGRDRSSRDRDGRDRSSRDRGGADRTSRDRSRLREPRHVRAVPTSVEQKIASAVELFNGSEHPRTIAGVARSLGAPTVNVAPADVRSSLVRLVISWELCWYRYEVDLSEDHPSVRIGDQGYELDELAPEEQQPNAVADDRGSLSF
jgi:hypothetical protein